MFCYLINVEKIEFFFIRSTDYNPIYIWIIPVQDWSKTSPVNSVCSDGTLNFSNVIDIDILLVKKIKNRCCVFDNQLTNLEKKAMF